MVIAYWSSSGTLESTGREEFVKARATQIFPGLHEVSNFVLSVT